MEPEEQQQEPVNTVALNQSEATPTVSIDLGVPPVRPSMELAKSRAYKFWFSGLGGILGKDYNDLEKDMSQGAEDNLRHQVSSTIDQHAAEAKLDKLRALGPTISLNDVNQYLAHEKTDPRMVMERAYARAYMSTLEDSTKNIGNGDWGEAKDAIPEHVSDTIKLGDEITTKIQTITTWYQNAQEAKGRQSYWGYGLDQLKTLVPLYSQLKQTGTIGLMGENIEKDVVRMLRLPPDEFNKQFSTTMLKLINDNPALAADYAQHFLGMSTSERMLNDAFGLIDIASIPGTGLGAKLIMRNARLFNASREIVKDVVASNAIPAPARVAAAIGAGDAKGAAVNQAAETVMKDIKDPIEGFKEKAKQALTTNFRSDGEHIQSDITKGNFSRELYTRLMNGIDSAGNFIDRLFTTARVENTPIALATEKQLLELQEHMTHMVPHYTDHGLNVSGPHETPLLGYHYRFELGNSEGELFSQEKHARISARAMRILDPIIEREGAGYKIVLNKAVPANNPILSSIYETVAEAKTPDSWFNYMFGRFRSPEDTLSAFDMQNRKAATYAPNEFMAFAREQANDIRAITKFWKKDKLRSVERLIKSGQKMTDEDGKLGIWYKTPSEINDWYLRNIGRPPGEDEVKAYFSFKRLVEMDRIFRNIMVLRNKYRMGTQRHSVFYFDKKSKRVDLPQFDGTVQTDWRLGEGTVLVFDKTGKPKLASAQAIARSEAWKESFDKGQSKLIRVYDPPSEREFATAAGDKDAHIRYVLTDKLESKELGWDQVPRRGGGHFERDFDHYVKQAKMVHDKTSGFNWYRGDTTLFGTQIRGVGQKFVKTLNDIRLLIKEGKLKEAEALHNEFIPDLKWERHLEYYTGRMTPTGGHIPPLLDKNMPIHLVPKDKMIVDVPDNGLESLKGFRDGTRQGSDANLSQVQYTKERDAFEVFGVDDKGSRHNPLFKLDSDNLIDGLPMMNRGLSRIIRSYFMDDAKMQSINHWIADAGAYLKGDPNMIARAPFKYFTAAEGKAAFTNATPVEKVKQLLANREKIQQFIGIPSIHDTFLHAMTQELADQIYNRFGSKGLLIPSKLLPFTKDPFRFVRSAVFDMKVGLFSVPQFFVHLTTYSTVLGVAGAKRAVPGTLGAFLHLWSAINPHMIDELDRMASHSLMNLTGSRWLPGEYKEAWQALHNTGFIKAEQEHAMIDSIYRNDIIRSGKDNFLNMGRVFFRSGLTSVRAAAWYTAYREMRDQFPHAVMDNAFKLKILNRADLLAHNMSRASSGFFNKGIFSWPLQFYTYQQRLAEMMLPHFGKRLTGTEKTRLFLTNAALFGLPVGASIYGYPLSDPMRQAAKEQGVVLGENFVSDTLAQGAMGMAMYWLTGEHYNPGERYGVKGIEAIDNVQRSDATWWKVLLGASGSTLADGIHSLDGFRRAISSSFKTMVGIQHENEEFPMMVDDFIQPLKEVSSVNTWIRAWQAANSGQWLAKRGTFLDKVHSTGEALFMSVLGLQHQELADTYATAGVIKQEKVSEEATLRRYVEEMGRYYRSAADGDWDNAKAYMKRAQSVLIMDGYPVERLSHAMETAAKIHDSLVKRVNWDYYHGKDIPRGKWGDRQESGKTYFNTQEEKNK